MHAPLAFAALLMTAAPATAATFAGAFWDHDGPLASLADADAVIAGGAPDAVFSVPLIDFPAGGAKTASDGTTLAAFLGLDAAALGAAAGATLDQSVFRFTGFLDLPAGEALFTVGSDDGFRLTVGDAVVSAFDGRRSFSETAATTDAGEGLTPFELIYYENQSVTGVEFSLNGALAVPTVVAAPAALPLLLAALGALAAFGRGGWRSA